MKKLLLSLLAATLLAGCVNSAHEMHVQVLPEGLKDCRFYELTNDGSTMKVIRCPNSSTTTSYHVRSGKSSTLHTNAVVDG